jgi:hypothetical protein
MKVKLSFNILVSRVAAIMSLVSIMVIANGCGDRTTGEMLAKSGMTTANTLAGYYDSLAQDTIDIWEMEAFDSSLRGLSFDENQQKPLQEQLDALNHRALLARRLASTYSALQQLSSYDASAGVKGAADKLAKEIKAIPVLPKSNVDPSDIVGLIAGDIAAWQQSRDIDKGSRLITEVLEKILKLFENETEACKSIAEERGNKVANIIDYLIREKKVVSWPLLQKGTEALGLPWASGQKPLEDEQTIKAMTELARVRVKRLALLSASAADSTAQSLTLLILNHKSFQNKKGLSLDEMLAVVQKAQSYLDEIGKLRAEKK